MDNIPTIDMVRTGNNITRLRMEAGLSVRDLQRILGFAKDWGKVFGEKTWPVK